MSKPQQKRKKQNKLGPSDIQQYATATGRKHLIWYNGAKHELDVFRIPTEHLHFNIQNGRYADKMIQLKADNPGEEIDPRAPKWHAQISRMLRGEYPGTQEDKEPWDRLCEDIKGKSQLTPGVVIADGGVIDGNRRLSVLLSLAGSEKNSTPYEYFDGVILPHDVSDGDRWRIEAGIQLGKDEKHDYSSINKLLKIKQGLSIFGDDDKGIRQIANALYGTTEKEIRQTMKEIALIDEYLITMGKPDAYNEVAGLTERFVEAVNILEAAAANGMQKKDFATLKGTLFVSIKGKLMDNWELRQVRTAIAAPKKEKSVEHINEKIVQELLDTGVTIGDVKAVLKDEGGTKSTVVKRIRDKAEKFLDQREILKKINEPLKLADSAKSNLEALHESLKQKLPKHPERDATLQAVHAVLGEVLKLVNTCRTQLKAKKG